MTLKPIKIDNSIILVDENAEIKEGDWVVFNELEIVKCTYSKNGEFLFSEPLTSSSNHHFSYFKKIILTTDQDLIKDGVQAIDDEFLEFIVKNPSCERVEVEKICNNCEEINCIHAVCSSQIALKKGVTYKIIIPKEEPEQFGKCKCTNALQAENCIRNCGHGEETRQETPEEAAEKACPIFNRSTPFGSKYPWTPKKEREAFIKGAKWQQERSYSKEEVKNIISKLIRDCYYMQEPNQDVAEWFEQFKKKKS